MSQGYMHSPRLPMPYYPWGHHHRGGCCSCATPPCPAPVVFLVPVAPVQAPCGCATPVSVPRDLEVDASGSPKEALVGGGGEVHLSLETFVEAGAASPSVEISLQENGTTSTISKTGLPLGYQVEKGFLTVSAGAKVSIAASDAIARLRWCETICC